MVIEAAIPVIRHPFTCRCAACLKRDPRRYVHDGDAEAMRKHLELIEARERAQGIRR